MSDFDPSALKLPEEISRPNWVGPSKHNAYYDSEKAAENYESEKARAQYYADKIIGRRRPDGRINLKKLSRKHKQIIAHYVMGVSATELAYMFDMSRVAIDNVLTDPLVQPYLDEFDESHKREFNAMLPLVNNSIRDALNSGGITNRLRGVDRWAKIHRVLNGEQKGEEGRSRTQEIHAARFRFLEKVKELAISSGAIEVEAVILENADADSG